MSRRQRESRIPGLLDHLSLALRALALIVALVAAAGLISVTIGNVVQAVVKIYRYDAENAGIRDGNAQTRRENHELKERIRELNTPEGAVAAGRKMGMVRRGEASVRITVPRAEAEVAPPPPVPAHGGEIILALGLFILAFLTGLLLLLRRRKARREEGVLLTRSELNRRGRLAH